MDRTRSALPCLIQYWTHWTGSDFGVALASLLNPRNLSAATDIKMRCEQLIWYKSTNGEKMFLFPGVFSRTREKQCGPTGPTSSLNRAKRSEGVVPDGSEADIGYRAERVPIEHSRSNSVTQTNYVPFHLFGIDST